MSKERVDGSPIFKRYEAKKKELADLLTEGMSFEELSALAQQTGFTVEKFSRGNAFEAGRMDAGKYEVLLRDEFGYSKIGWGDTLPDATKEAIRRLKTPSVDVKWIDNTVS